MLLIENGTVLRRNAEFDLSLNYFRMPILKKARVGQGKQGNLRGKREHDLKFELFRNLQMLEDEAASLLVRGGHFKMIKLIDISQIILWKDHIKYVFIPKLFASKVFTSLGFQLLILFVFIFHKFIQL